jgi:dihydroorotate dehydrogenase
MAFDGRIGHLEGIESPWANAGGVVKTVEDVERMAHTGVGWIEAGSYTLEPRKGNKWNPETNEYDSARTDYDHNTETGLTYNSLGMPNSGMDVVEREIPEMVRIAHSLGKALAINVAPVSDKPLSETVELVRRGYAAGADVVIVNAGCPNVKDPDGKQHKLLSRSPWDFGQVMYLLANARISKPVWVRISPQDSLQGTQNVTRHMIKSGIVSALLDPNTWPVPMPRGEAGVPLLGVPMETVGKSGPAMANKALRETTWAIKALTRSRIDVISSSGIMSAQELKRRLAIGAVAGAGTTFFYESQNGWREDTDRLLSELAD